MQLGALLIYGEPRALSLWCIVQLLVSDAKTHNVLASIMLVHSVGL